MSNGTVLFIHGTGVRLAGLQADFEQTRRCAQRAGIVADLVPCVWGDALGSEFTGLSLPGPPSQAQLNEEGEDLARWAWLFYDPWSELDKLTIAVNADDWGIGDDGWGAAWSRIREYKLQPDLEQLLAKANLVAYWDTAWSTIVTTSEIPGLAFERSGDKWPEAGDALARALVAQLHLCATGAGHPGPSRYLRDSLVRQMRLEWKMDVLAPADFFQRMFRRTATSILRRNRYEVSIAVAKPIGDILLYQAQGEKIRNFIAKKIMQAHQPVTIVAHSLGGIAAFDLLALHTNLSVERLITVGSQVPLLYEFGALASLAPGEKLRAGFPRWLNIYDPDDFLSYVAQRLFDDVEDYAAASGQPFPDSHSAYFVNEAVWEKILKF